MCPAVVGEEEAGGKHGPSDTAGDAALLLGLPGKIIWCCAPLLELQLLLGVVLSQGGFCARDIVPGFFLFLYCVHPRRDLTPRDEVLSSAKDFFK